MSTPTRPSSAKLAKLALLGFMVGSITERATRASVLYYAVSVAVLAGVTTTSAVGVASVVVMVVWVSQQLGEDEEVPEGYTSRLLIDSALVAQRGDLGVQIQLLTESPTAFAQLDREMALGAGPALDALKGSTNLPVERLQAAWDRAKAPVDVVDTPEEANLVVYGFLIDVAPELDVGRDARAELAWALARESADPRFPEEARTHAWLAEWMGVSPESLSEATQAALSALPGVADKEPRPFIYANPDAFLDALCAHLERTEQAAIDARLATLGQDAAHILPPELQQDLLAAAAR